MSEPATDKNELAAWVVAAWGAILFLPAMLAFVVLAAGGLADWMPLIPRRWAFEAFTGFNLGYVLIAYVTYMLLMRRRAEKKSPVSPAPPIQDDD